MLWPFLLTNAAILFLRTAIFYDTDPGWLPRWLLQLFHRLGFRKRWISQKILNGCDILCISSGRKYGILINLVNQLVKCKLQKKQNADLKFLIDELLLIFQGEPEVVVIPKINSWHLRKKGIKCSQRFAACGLFAFSRQPRQHNYTHSTQSWITHSSTLPLRKPKKWRQHSFQQLFSSRTFFRIGFCVGQLVEKI